MNTQFTTRRVLCTGIDDSNIDPEVMKKMQKSIGEIMEHKALDSMMRIVPEEKVFKQPYGRGIYGVMICIPGA